MFPWRLWMERTSMTQGTTDYRLMLLEYDALKLAMSRACLIIASSLIINTSLVTIYFSEASSICPVRVSIVKFGTDIGDREY
jgi:hypothetical protein